MGEIENVNHAFQPDGRLRASNSPYPFNEALDVILPEGMRIEPAGKVPCLR